MPLNPDHEPLRLEGSKRSRARLILWGLAAIALLGAGLYGGLRLQQSMQQSEAALVEAPLPPPAAHEDTEPRLQAIEGHLRRVDERLDKLEQAVASAPPITSAPAEAGAVDTSGLQKQIAELAVAVADVREATKQAEQKVDQNHSFAQDVAARILAFTQLRAAALSGVAFTEEEQAMRQVAGQDSALLDSLARIEPFAPRGVGDYAALREDYENLRAPAQVALRKSEAQSWWDRVMAALKGIVTVRSLHAPSGGGDDVFATIANDLEHHRLNLVLDRLKELPDPAQAVLKDWREKVEARQKLESTLNEMATRLMRGE